MQLHILSNNDTTDSISLYISSIFISNMTSFMCSFCNVATHTYKQPIKIHTHPLSLIYTQPHLYTYTCTHILKYSYTTRMH